MKLRTVKGKVLVGVVAVGLFSGAGFAFANTGAGDALKQWYDGAFGEAVEEATGEAEEYGEEVFEGLLEEFEELKANAAAAIEATRDSETTNAANEIEAAMNAHIESIENAQSEIEAQMGIKFYNVYMVEWLEIQRLAEEAKTAAEADLTQFTDGEASVAINQLTADLTEAKDAAVTELDDAVEAAKADLTVQLDTHSINLTNNLTKEVNFSAEKLRDDVTAIKEELVATQQSLIATTAAELTEDAKDALDDVVNNINN